MNYRMSDSAPLFALVILILSGTAIVAVPLIGVCVLR